MIRRFAPALLCLAVLLVAARLSTASSHFRVNEDATRLSPGGESAHLSLAFENSAGRGFAARVHVELLDPRGVVRARTESDATIGAGRGAHDLALPFRLSSLTETERSELPWFRLRYRVAPATDAPAAEGVVSLSSITPDLFELHLSTPAYTFQGMRFRARAHAFHPATRVPAPGVRLAAEASLGRGEANTLRASAVTGPEGEAVFDFALPEAADGDDEVKLVVRGRRGEVTQEAEAESSLIHHADILVGTDKPLYQPGQTVRLRALLRDQFARRVLPGAEATLTVRDPEGKVVFRTGLRASRFGVAAADWPVAEGTRLGSYTAIVEIEDGPYENNAGGTNFSVSRYELPTFAVATEPDRKFYLPGEDAEVTVRADYLFGRPVPHGRVRVVRESERRWDYQKQKWEIKEEQTFEGEADAEGRFRARLPLAEEHARLAAEEADSRFLDAEYAAYVTDPSTNRTEQRRFDLRVTREPVHVYVITPEPGPAAGFPAEFYLSTFYADGTPAACEVAVAEAPATAPILPSSPAPRALASVRTNRYGLAKVSGLTLTATDDDDARLAFTARDERGRVGRAVEDFDLDEGTAARVETDKTLYRAGEPLVVRLSSNHAGALFALDVVQNQRLLHTQPVRLRDGRATVRIPPRPEFRDEVTVFAYALDPGEGDDDGPHAARTVLFPRAEGLRVDVRLDRDEYRPGAEARADIRLRDAEGREVEGALGVVVTDRAVAERARTDAEFGRTAEDFDAAVRQRLGEGRSLAGVTLQDLNRLDTAKPLPDGLDLLVEVMLNQSHPTAFESSAGAYASDPRVVFERLLAEQLKPLREALAAAYERGGAYPRDETSLRRLLDAAGVSVDELRDPWGRPYELRFGTERELDFFELVSGAADKRRASADDFVALRQTWPYFRPQGLVVERVVKEHFQRTGRPVRDRETLREELRREGFDLDAPRDPWGRPYEVRFEAGARALVLNFRSAGPDGRLGGADGGDDFTVWQVSVNYFEEEERRIRRALDAATSARGHFPRDEAEFREALRRAGIGPRALEDPWDRPYRLTFTERPWSAGHVTVRMHPRGAAHAATEVEQTRVRRGRYAVVLSSLGPDGLPNTYDDFYVTEFAQVLEDRSVPAAPSPPAAEGAGELRGVVLDPLGAVITGATVRATHRPSGASREMQTDAEGHFYFADLPAGAYELSVEAQHFVALKLIELTVSGAHVTEVAAALEVGAVTEVVMVTAEAELSLTLTSAQVSRTVNVGHRTRRATDAAGLRRPPAETPRLREYFPETLVWQPLVETDAAGRASLNFKLADNVTTWKLSVVGSTLDGELGLAEADVTAFQPFFVEHDPPRVLTEGDEISLPVVLRNYLARPQEVGLELKPESWFAPLGPTRRRARVAAETAARETFDFRAVAPVREGRQRVTALGSDESDAIEKTVNVLPNGEEVAQTTTHLLSEAEALELDFPAATLAGTARAELKLYPGLSAHLVESVEAVMSRPYGCGEQTISSTYPSLLVLRHHRAHAATGEPPAVVRRAERYLHAGYERLLNYRTPAGGFAYWSDEAEPSLALTAYALKFLSDARGVIEVDEGVVDGARRWLWQQAGPAGGWGAGGATPSNSPTALRFTAYVARVLAEAGGGGEAARTSNALSRALDLLARHAAASDDPFLLASFVLAARARGSHAESAQAAARRLLALRRDERAQTFWDVQGSTPFHGWGLTGRVEMTALAARALADAAADEQSQAAVRRALLYLIRAKDRYGVWYSTQATVNVLDALDAVAGLRAATPSDTDGVAAEIYVNGRHATSVVLLGAHGLGAPVTVDLTPHLSAPGRNRVEARLASGAGDTAAQLVSTHYVAWGSAERPAPAAGRPSLKIGFDRTEAVAGQPVSCRVEATRGAEGYGMLLAEVGLPPGAEVDRASLERALSAAGSALYRYDVLPDRLVLYLWPIGAGSARLDFTFRPRYGLRALTAPSQIYDYYNPEARAVVAPVRFVVR